MFLEAIALPLFALAATAQTQNPWGQCGGNGWSGATECGSGYYCTRNNEWYHQCIPGTDTVAPPPSSTTTQTDESTASTNPETTITSDVLTSASIETSSTLTTTGSTAGPTLVNGWYWIRAVVDPNYHKYLQTQPLGVVGQAYIDDGPDAGQFNIIDGQLVYNTGPNNPVLYMHVETPGDETIPRRKLATWFDTEPTGYGVFEFQGDTLTWSAEDVERQNNAAWLVCENQELFVNLGAYAYQTPEGCADQTIHSYGGSTADL